VPELPDITVYLEALESRVPGQRLEKVELRSPFLLRTAEPRLETLCGKRVLELRRLGKRIVLGFEEELWLSIHLMIAGRLHWLDSVPAMAQPDSRPGAAHRRRKPPGKPNQQARLEFETGVLVLTEAGTKRRASLHLVKGQAALRALDPGGLDVMTCTVEEFARRFTEQNHTLKRALTDPRLFSGIGNAYSDELLHKAQLSPVMLTQKLSLGEIERLHRATRATLNEWIERLRDEAGGGFPENVTAFRPEMAVHGKFGQPCPVCGTTVQRIRYAENETNYCPGCQTGGRLLADRSLSLLLKKDWPRTPEELEELRGGGKNAQSAR
jgi:formamidopyrimidine-DNA glycosylase